MMVAFFVRIRGLELYLFGLIFALWGWMRVRKLWERVEKFNPIFGAIHPLKPTILGDKKA